MITNVSKKGAASNKFLVDTLEVFAKNRADPSEIKLEISGSVLLEHIDTLISILEQFWVIGINFSMDDFGVGYSSPGYLIKLPISSLTIDRSFISQIDEEAESLEIVKSIILLSKTLKLQIVAEGIETLEQHEMLCELGAELGQGYFYSKPLMVKDMPEYFRSFEEKSGEIPSIPLLPAASDHITL